MTVEDYEAKRIIENLRRDHAPVYHWDTFDRRLERCVKDYADRRTIHAHMVRDIAALAYGYVAEQAAAGAEERAVEVAKLEGVIERMEKGAESQRTIIASLNARLDEKRTIREERAAAAQDGDTDVTISNAYQGWTVSMLEEIAYRLRSGGADDDTPVDVDGHRAKATVPAPNLVTLYAAEKPTAVAPPPQSPAVATRRLLPSSTEAKVATGVAVAFLLMILGRVIS